MGVGKLPLNLFPLPIIFNSVTVHCSQWLSFRSLIGEAKPRWWDIGILRVRFPLAQSLSLSANAHAYQYYPRHPDTSWIARIHAASSLALNVWRLDTITSLAVAILFALSLHNLHHSEYRRLWFHASKMSSVSNPANPCVRFNSFSTQSCSPNPALLVRLLQFIVGDELQQSLDEASSCNKMVPNLALLLLFYLKQPSKWISLCLEQKVSYVFFFELQTQRQLSLFFDVVILTCALSEPSWSSHSAQMNCQLARACAIWQACAYDPLGFLIVYIQQELRFKANSIPIKE